MMHKTCWVFAVFCIYGAGVSIAAAIGSVIVRNAPELARSIAAIGLFAILAILSIYKARTCKELDND